MRTTDRHIDIGPHKKLEHSKQMTDADDRHGVVGKPAEVGPFDREIDLKSIFWTGLVLVLGTVVSCILMWYLLKGMRSYDERRDPPPSPISAAQQQPAPPEPRLQTTPEEDLRMMRAEEDALLGQPTWVDQGQGTARIPVDVAMEVIATRGLGPEVVGGNPGAAAGTSPQEVRQTLEGTPEAVRQNNAGRQQGALIQMARPPVVPAQPQPGTGTGQQGRQQQSPPQP